MAKKKKGSAAQKRATKKMRAALNRRLAARKRRRTGYQKRNHGLGLHKQTLRNNLKRKGKGTVLIILLPQARQEQSIRETRSETR